MENNVMVDHQPLVSVVIIFYNAARFMQEAIESVLAQSYRYWELLLVDDGSTDGSTDIAHQYTDSYPESISYLQHQAHANHGMSASRNLGIQNARGKYISFLDADDVWFPTILMDQVEILESQPEAAFVYGPLLYWHSWSGLTADHQRDYVEGLGVEAETLIQPPNLLALFLQDRAAIPSGILVCREAIEQYGAFEEAFQGEYEDQVFCAKICLHAPVFASNKCWYRYRQHDDSCVSVGQRTGKTDTARLFFLNWLAIYLSHQKVKSSQIWLVLHYERLRCTHPRLFPFVQYGMRITNHWNERLRQSWAAIWNPS
jgi:glycosyltransferase involved in cell wall biosynthesis